MGKRICLAILLLALSLAGAGCGASPQGKDPAHGSQIQGTEAKAGKLSCGYYFGEDGITVSSAERFLYSDWDPAEFDYICMDPTCSHLSGNCSARTIQDENSILRDFSLVYRDRLIILHACSTLEIDEVSDTVRDWIHIYQTDVYEADLDGNNRRKMVTFSGSIGTPTITYAAVSADGKLYFGGPTKERERMELDAQGLWQMAGWWTSGAVYCLDLEDYTLESFAVTEDKAGAVYQYQFYEFDGRIYAITSDFPGDSAVWYRIDPRAGACEEILRFDSDVGRFLGAIGDTVYYWYESSWKTLYARDISAGAEEREVMTAAGEDGILLPFVLDGQLLCMTDYCAEGEAPMSEYTVLDPEGKVLDTIHYDSYINFLDVVGDKIIYYRLDSDSVWKAWWVDKEELANLQEKGVPIGPLSGSTLDTLED